MKNLEAVRGRHVLKKSRLTCEEGKPATGAVAIAGVKNRAGPGQ